MMLATTVMRSTSATDFDLFGDDVALGVFSPGDDLCPRLPVSIDAGCPHHRLAGVLVRALVLFLVIFPCHSFPLLFHRTPMGVSIGVPRRQGRHVILRVFLLIEADRG